MSLGRKKQDRQQQFWGEADSLPDVPRHVFNCSTKATSIAGSNKPANPTTPPKPDAPGFPPAFTFECCSSSTSKESTRSTRNYIPEPESGYERRRTDKPPGYEEAYRANRHQMRGRCGRDLQKKRSDYVELSFALVQSEIEE